MEDKKILNNEELEKVSGGLVLETNDNNLVWGNVECEFVDGDEHIEKETYEHEGV